MVQTYIDGGPVFGDLSEELSDEDLEKVAGGAGVSGELSGILRSALTQGLP